MIKCPNCTGEMNFDPKAQQVKCEYCGSVFDPKELQEKVKMSGEQKNITEEAGESIEGKSFTCSQCGAVLLTFDETAITFCSYCGSQAMIESKMMKVNKPDFIIPFAKTKEDCIAAYKSKLKKAMFAPEYLKSDVILEKFRGIYIPYAIYKLEHKGEITNKGSKYSHRSGDYVYYDDYTITANIDASYEGISYDLISKFYDKFSTAIPYNYKKKEEFNPNYLIGFYADAGDVDSAIYDSEVEQTIIPDTTKRLRTRKEFSKYGCSTPTANIKVSERKIGMFPVYFLAIRNKDNKTVNYAVVNGQTGQVAADLPISFSKYVIGSLLLSILTFILVNYIFILTPKAVAVFSIAAGILSLIITAVQSSKINAHESHTDDKGYVSVHKDTKTKKNNTFKYYIKEVIASILPAIALFMNFVNDAYYYGAAIISLALVLLSFSDLVKEHNILVTNKLPQLEKRGGDESE